MSPKLFETLKIISALFRQHWLFAFFIFSTIYLELIFRLWSLKDLSFDFVFALLFSLSSGTVLYILSSMFSPKINKIVSSTLLSMLILIYCTQLIYFNVFKTPLSFFSLTGAGNILQFQNIILDAILKNVFAIILLIIPLAIFIFLGRKYSFNRLKLKTLCFAFGFFLFSYMISLISINLTSKNDFSQYTLYYKASIPELSVKKLGLMTTMKLDIKRLVFGFDHTEPTYNSSIDTNPGDSVACDVYSAEATPNPDCIDKLTSPCIEPENTPFNSVPSPEPSYGTNIMNINFEDLIHSEKNKTILDMHKYFSSIEPTKKNAYTGIFKENNLILITAEGFSPYAISQELTPTLYKMSTEGFVFNNFYNPIWGVSTSDGEYVACTGLLPKAGVWSFSRSGKNYMPFAMGNQFKELGYTTKAYHNHSYNYYNRNITHPNMGYEYKGVGNGLKINSTWPESDLEMINVTVDEYIGSSPFHTYYMTISGHLNYSFGGNYIARKNKDYVKDLPYSDASKAYIACNMELEFAMKSLIEKLEANGLADNTVIAISPDHYPYGLPKANIDELAGHEVEENFELYKSTFILWKKGIETVTIDKPCSSLDIIPTLSNLFGLNYDSRLMMGSDILSDADPLVIFSNRSWITDKAMFNSVTNSIEYTSGKSFDGDYVKDINKIVSDKFYYSAKILDMDYYKKVIGH
jgi:lipoteichoic acid synthase